MANIFTYNHLLIAELAVFAVVLALTLRKPEVVTTKSGNTVERPRSRMGVICTLVVIAVTWALHMTGFQFSVIIHKGKNIVTILEKLFNPKWSFFPKVVGPLVDTIKMSILGTVIGCVAALPIAVLASSNIDHNKFVVSLLRVLLGLIRTLPTLVIALVCALGANKVQAFWSACVPQILPVYLSHCLYCFEMNVRASAILGYVGAGGLGITINERIGWRDYNGLGMVLLSLLVVVVIIEFLSEYLRKKLS